MSAVAFVTFPLPWSPTYCKSPGICSWKTLYSEALSSFQQNVIFSKAFSSSLGHNQLLCILILCSTFLITCPDFGLSLLPLCSLMVTSLGWRLGFLTHL